MVANRNVGRQSFSHGKGGKKSANRNTYLTPKPLLAYVYTCLEQVNLDPCSNSYLSPQVVAEHYYTEEDNGLQHVWHGRCFINPPYNAVSLWAAKYLYEHYKGHMSEGILLVAASTETRWYQLLGCADTLICHINQRLWFDQAPNMPCKERARFPSVLFYLGNRPERFRDIFSELGFVR